MRLIPKTCYQNIFKIQEINLTSFCLIENNNFNISNINNLNDIKHDISIETKSKSKKRYVAKKKRARRKNGSQIDARHK